MITNLFITAGIYVGNMIVTRLPVSSGFPPDVIEYVTFFGAAAKSYFWMLPIPALLIALGIVFVADGVVFGWKTFKSLISHVPWIGGSK